ncbi:MAG: DUF1653 domain-containing protein [Lachnospiraceae bacterium]|nr:DUF1653 domain-containing protein [Lachnospiraceae bacterium]
MEIPMPGQIYRHFKGRYYQVIAVATHSETRKQLVVYQALYGDYGIFARPIESFTSDTDMKKYPNATQQKRFQLVDRDQLIAEKTRAAAERKASVASSGAVSAPAPEKDRPAPQGEAVTAGMEQPSSEDYPEGVNPDLITFLEAPTNEKKLEILLEMRDKIDDRLMNSIEASLDIGGGEGSLEERMGYVTSHLRAHARYESRRLRG